MGMQQDAGKDVVTCPDDARQIYTSSFKPVKKYRLGTEWERPLVVTDTGLPATYVAENGQPGIVDLLRNMQRFGWKPQYEQGNLIALHRTVAGGNPQNPLDKEWVTLEPGGQVEFSSAAQRTAGKLHGDLHHFEQEIVAVSDELGLTLLGAGYLPTSAPVADLVVPKSRYQQMWPSLNGKPESIDAGCRTGSVQVSFDYKNEQDMVEKSRLGLAITPIVTALFNNSALRQGELSGVESWRMERWNQYAPERLGNLSRVFDQKFGIDSQLDYMFQLPLYFLVRNGVYVPGDGKTFAQHAASGEATLSDFADHNTTQPPYFRIKKVLEACAMDSVRTPDMVADAPAFWSGLMYDDLSRKQAWELVQDWDKDVRDQLRTDAPVKGLHMSTPGGKTARDVAKDLLKIAGEGLIRRGEDPALLQPLWDVVQKGSHAERVVAQFGELANGGKVANEKLVSYYAPDPVPRHHTGYSRPAPRQGDELRV